MASIGIVLSGCGVNDGTEIHEAVLTMLCLDQKNAEISFFAPDKNQTDVIDHATGIKTTDSRNIKSEAARISRGKIQDIKEADPAQFDALIIPGGAGSMKNLSDLNYNPKSPVLDEDIKKLILKTNELRKPIGAICISPILIAMALGDLNPHLTIGNDRNFAKIIEDLGGIHVEKKATEICFDQKNIIISTPAYMLANGPSEVYEGVLALVNKIYDLI